MGAGYAKKSENQRNCGNLVGMTTTYNRIAGQSVERLAALSDGIFGVAMTLLLLGLEVPNPQRIGSGRELLHALVMKLPDLLVYLMSFLTLGIFWVGQQTQLNYTERSDRHMMWIHLMFLFVVTIVPFSTRLLVTFLSMRPALLVYWGNIFVLGMLLYAAVGYANRAKLFKEEIPIEIPRAICRRVMIAQLLYALGAALCVFSTRWSIGFIVLVQLNYVVAPRFSRRT